jgi:4-hydroxybenzoate polyprenyltransferase
VEDSANRWWVYQRERFPLTAHAPVVLAFTFSAVAFSGFLRGHFGLPSLASALTAFSLSLLFFLELRLADEFKDFDDDSRYRPYRPVPRGLVKLSELAWVGVGAIVAQAVVAAALSPRLLVLLAVTWAYLGLMSKEFFISSWLKAHPLLYLTSHMVILPFIDLCATACDWLPAKGAAPDGLIWFLVMSYFNGVVIEVGRKLRAPQDEETGVETYTSLYGPLRAVALWLGAMSLAAAGTIVAAAQVGAALPVAIVLVAVLALAAAFGIRFVAQPLHARSRFLEPVSGAWVIIAYLSLGVIPLLVK